MGLRLLALTRDSRRYLGSVMSTSPEGPRLLDSAQLRVAETCYYPGLNPAIKSLALACFVYLVYLVDLRSAKARITQARKRYLLSVLLAPKGFPPLQRKPPSTAPRPLSGGYVLRICMVLSVGRDRGGDCQTMGRVSTSRPRPQTPEAD